MAFILNEKINTIPSLNRSSFLSITKSCATFLDEVSVEDELFSNSYLKHLKVMKARESKGEGKWEEKHD